MTARMWRMPQHLGGRHFPGVPADDDPNTIMVDTGKGVLPIPVSTLVEVVPPELDDKSFCIIPGLESTGRPWEVFSRHDELSAMATRAYGKSPTARWWWHGAAAWVTWEEIRAMSTTAPVELRPFFTNKARGRCSVCEVVRSLRADGTMPSHRLPRSGRECDGVGMPPRAVPAADGE